MSATLDKKTGLYFNNILVYQDDVGIYVRLWSDTGRPQKMYILNSAFTLNSVVSNLNVLEAYYQNSKKTPVEKLVEACKGYLQGSPLVTHTDLQKAFAEYQAAEAKKKEF